MTNLNSIKFCSNIITHEQLNSNKPCVFICQGWKKTSSKTFIQNHKFHRLYAQLINSIPISFKKCYLYTYDQIINKHLNSNPIPKNYKIRDKKINTKNNNNVVKQSTEVKSFVSLNALQCRQACLPLP